MPSANDTFVSKRDGWIVAVIWGAAALSLAALAPLLGLQRACSPSLLVISAFGAIACAGIGPWLLYDTRYAFEPGRLVISSGPFRWRVPLAEIARVEPSRDPISSPACSLDRLLIRYGARRILVSPADRAGFLRRLAALCPQLRLEGERLSSAP
jgi:hypothetical protein